MIKRTIFISNPVRLFLKHEQMKVQVKETGREASIPIEDIGFVVIENMQVSLSMPLLAALNANNVGVIFCNDKHMPVSMLLNLDGHSIQTEIFAHQLKASEPLKKRLWQQTIVTKIQNQAAHLELQEKPTHGLSLLAKQVQSGDSTNREGMAARIYWQSLLGKGFVRDRYGEPPNFIFNYIYIVLRAAVARALTGSGLLPTLGIHHHNRYNSFCLADDIMEPYRPLADQVAMELYKANPDIIELETAHKMTLLKLLQSDVNMGKQTRPFILALSETTASLARCFAGESRKITYPILN